jgi:hypothetical protein
MYFFALKTLISALIIAFASWLSGKKPELAGLIVSLPLSTMLVLLFSYAEYNDPAASVRFGKSIIMAIPFGLPFFIPFIMANKLPFGFWGIYALGVILLVASYYLYSYLTKAL